MTVFKKFIFKNTAKILAKLVLLVGAILGTVFLSEPSLVNSPIEKIKSSDSKKIEKIASLEDIEIFEKQNNCSFGFVQKWDDKEVYNIREFLKANKDNPKNKRNRFERISVRFANKFRDKCKKRKAIALFFYEDKFNLHGHVFKEF